METFEKLMFFTFLAGYAYSTILMLLIPEKVRINEIRFYSSPSIDLPNAFLGFIASISVAAMVAHLWLEGYVWSQTVLYLNIVIFVFYSAAHGAGDVRRRKLEWASAADARSYHAQGIRKLAILILIVVLPITLPR
jgi:hypothetical protein